jgi:septum formation protein
MNNNPSTIILASSSKYRRKLLSRVLHQFRCVAPEVDETKYPNESPEKASLRLAKDKALTVANQYKQAWVIGSDQVASLEEHILDKPGSAAKAIEQLIQFSNKIVTFYTSVYLINLEKNFRHHFTDKIEVKFRNLSKSEIENYVRYDEPLDCAGSFKVESAGIALFEYVKNNDPTALEGLPLIKTCELIRLAGLGSMLRFNPCPIVNQPQSESHDTDPC